MSTTDATPLTSSPRASARPPLLLGILVDVSASMRQQWHSTDGRPLPRARVLLQALNRAVESFRHHGQQDSLPAIDVFCLGFGFRCHVTPIYDLETEEANPPQQEQPCASMGLLDLVCDLLALSEIVPRQADLERFQQLLHRKWQQCAGTVFEQTAIVANAFGELVDYIEQALHESATRRLQRSLLARFARLDCFPRLAALFQEQLEQRAVRIREISRHAAREYADSVFNQANRHFKRYRDHYVHIIERHLERFAKTYVVTALQSFVLGFTLEEIVDDLDEEQALTLARRIYADLQREVEQHVTMVLTLLLGKLMAQRRLISARLDRRTVESLTRRFLQKHGWDILRPLIEETVLSLFLRQFQCEARNNLQRWIRLASSREVIRPLKSLSTLVPAEFEEQLCTAGVLFGATPFQEALDWAARRFLEPCYQQHRKVLLIISDGAFPYAQGALITARLLKRRGVVIISGLIHRQRLLDRFCRSAPQHWPPGARCMLELASELPEEEGPAVSTPSSPAPSGKKCCYQLNHADLLGPFLDCLLTDPVVADG
ncbi:MAG: VWA domain-containing protein [Thermogemmatispora sp.]|jgi:hypothetical protein|uniref:VWA domain-containing protein n=1 Tax=Thermogemmatispora TaxID=768669 RepID=UPI0008533121|nr:MULTISPECIES: VWA domain-containing protein [Thermogemmatispora]MBE3568125.1 VWA domain-containing protein [Thermogemmatispora sp.]MBX5459207.1 VWA domain-containing protein [Thermogemmatispora sp.]